MSFDLTVVASSSSLLNLRLNSESVETTKFLCYCVKPESVSVFATDSNLR